MLWNVIMYTVKVLKGFMYTIENVVMGYDI